jgi:tetratricopeptide (TPR) repeat protein
MSLNNINLDFIERYQKLYEKDPHSKVFAPLGEAYRKMGLLKEAMDILKVGVRLHPHFPSGRVALAKVFMDSQKYEEAIEQLLAASDVSPENLLAHRLLADCYLQTKSTKKALKAYKMVLFLNPNDAQAQSHVKKLESITADEYEDEAFEMKPLRAEMAPHRGKIEVNKKQAPSTDSATYKERQLERILSLTDAFIARLDIDRALETLQSAENQIGKHPEIDKRKNFIQCRIDEAKEFDNTSVTVIENPTSKTQRIDLLQNLLQKIESKR